MPLTCILFALRRESQPFCQPRSAWRTVAGAPCTARRRGDLLVLETGVGVERTRAALDWLIPQSPSFAIFAGFCGALRANFSIGDVVLATEVVDEAGGCWQGNERLHDSLTSCAALRGRLLTTTHLVGDPGEKKGLGERYHADIVDMESAAFARVCIEKSIPFACVRVVSDDVQTKLSPKLVELMAGGQVSGWAVAKALVKRPSLMFELLRLAKHTKLAAANLATVLEAIIRSKA